MRLDDILRKAQKQIAGGPVEIAMGTVHELDKLRPLPVPPPPADAAQWEKRLTGPVGAFASEVESALYVVFLDNLKIRSGVVSENERRLRATLWAEAELRRAGRPEADLVREFNETEWGIAEPAADGCDGREAVVRERIRAKWREFDDVPTPAASNTNSQRYLKLVE